MGTALAVVLPVLHHFALVDDLFAAGGAVHAHHGPADNCFDRRGQAHRLNGEQLGVGHTLIAD